MCHILYVPGTTGTDDETQDLIRADLRRAAEVNAEGFGFAGFRRDGTLATLRYMKPGLPIRWFLQWRLEHPGTPAVFHCRLATTGHVSLDECHPVLTPDGQYALLLNGTLPEPWSAPGKNDTQEFALTLYEMVRWRDDLNSAGDLTDLVPVLGGLIGKQNRMVIMTGDPAQPEKVHVINRDQWITTPYGALASQPDHLGQGAGWDEMTDGEGDLYRWNILQPGQCAGCHLYGCERGCAPRPYDPPRWRNETKRKERTA